MGSVDDVNRAQANAKYHARLAGEYREHGESESLAAALSAAEAARYSARASGKEPM